MSGPASAVGLFGLVLLAGVAIVLLALLGIALRRSRERRRKPPSPTAHADAWAEAGRRAGRDPE